MKEKAVSHMHEKCPLKPFACPMCDACGIFSSGGFTEKCICISDREEERPGGDAL